MPILVGMAAIAYAELQRNLCAVHGLHKLDVAVEQEVIVATIHVPLHRAELLLTDIVSLQHVVYAAVLTNRLVQYLHLILRVSRLL